MQIAHNVNFNSYAGFKGYYSVRKTNHKKSEKYLKIFFYVHRDVHYENFRAQCISQIAQQGLRERGKLKRDSISSQNDASITETDRLLLQKDEEVIFKYVWHLHLE